ncbi:hypothetical protein Nepgr_014605 [Nepenthes gracilis]|uniref:Uncharacterized protein n=1 Tax=Nepenthes gracilis TaxID=150966 RepID=A0AAD3XQA5_NEPGR|nr:hypothetical protein Nepgr_014605 [Nepenthes gracilis]
MSLSFVGSLFHQFHTHRLLMCYAGTWTALLVLTVAVASFWPEIAFMSAIAPSSAKMQSCSGGDYVRIPLDLPGERFCFPSHAVQRSTFDILIPFAFAGLVVAGSTTVLRSLGLRQSESS